MSTPGAIVGNVIFVGPARLTTLIGASFTTVLALEAARRAVRVVANLMGYSPSNKVSNFFSRWSPEVITNLTRAIESPRDIRARVDALRVEQNKIKVAHQAAAGKANPTQKDNELTAALKQELDEVDAELRKEEKYANDHKGIKDIPLLTALLGAVVVVNIGWEFSKWLTAGEISPWYNRVARCIGPLVLDETYRHPVVQMGVDVVKNAFPRLK
jgi:hypothetical protein